MAIYELVRAQVGRVYGKRYITFPNFEVLEQSNFNTFFPTCALSLATALTASSLASEAAEVTPPGSALPSTSSRLPRSKVEAGSGRDTLTDSLWSEAAEAEDALRTLSTSNGMVNLSLLPSHVLLTFC